MVGTLLDHDVHQWDEHRYSQIRKAKTLYFVKSCRNLFRYIGRQACNLERITIPVAIPPRHTILQEKNLLAVMYDNYAETLHRRKALSRWWAIGGLHCMFLNTYWFALARRPPRSGQPNFNVTRPIIIHVLHVARFKLFYLVIHLLYN